tara:strand:+ start:167 stop:553 length:387 start_codon:yes stop_codon:yes gene_type:complete
MATVHDITKYQNLRQKTIDLYKVLSDTRKELKLMEAQMLDQMLTLKEPMLPVRANNQDAIIRIQDRKRRIPLTILDLRTTLRMCLQEKFGHAAIGSSIEEFAVAISERIWAQRRTKVDKRLVVKTIST